MKINRGVAAVLKQAGATLIRHSKHYIFQLPNGKKLTVSSTPSDQYAVNNQLREIKQAGGLVEEKRRNPDRVEKQGRMDTMGHRTIREWMLPDKPAGPVGATLAQQLSTTGIAERALRTQVATLLSELDIKNATIQYQEVRIERYQQQIATWQCPCFVCRLRRYFHV